MNQVYTCQQLESVNRTKLWSICRTNGIPCYPKSADCVEAILSKQSKSVEKVTEASVKVEQAPQNEEITTGEISFYDHEVYASGKKIASITHDPSDFQTQRWVVMVGDIEAHRADSWAKCHSYITWHYKQGTLQQFSSLSSKLQEFTSLSSHYLNPTDQTEVIELDEYKLVYAGGESPKSYLVYKSDVLCGMIWDHLTHWSNGIDNIQHNQPLPAASGLNTLVEVDDEPTSCEQLLDKPFDELSKEDWERLKAYVPHSQAELLAA